MASKSKARAAAAAAPAETPAPAAEASASAPAAASGKRKAKKSASDAISTRSSIEKFEVQEIERHEIQNAEYNPRVISGDARRRLRAGIKKLGLLQPLVWNKRTGNLVGGHQRLAILDKLHNGEPYRLTVAAVDLTPTKEIEANLLLNNNAAMGDFDLVKLEQLIKIPELDIEATGWDRADVYRLFGSEKSLAELEPEKAQEVAEAVRKTADEYQNNLKRAADRDNPDYYLVIVFKGYGDRKDFTDRLGLEDNRYQSGAALVAAMGLEDDD